MQTEQSDHALSVLEDVCGTKVTVETVKGVMYTGTLDRLDRSHGDMELSDVRVQERDASIAVVERVFVPGRTVRLVAMTSALKAVLTANINKTNYVEMMRKSLKRKRAAGTANKSGGGKRQGEPKMDATRRKLDQRVRKLQKH